jgi:hypothetical protein
MFTSILFTEFRSARRIAATLAILVLATTIAVAHPETLGIVTQARSANVGNAAVSPGASLYSGDRLSTDANGTLTLRAGTSTLYLAKATLVMLRDAAANSASAHKTVQAELSAGTVAFSIQPAAPLEISAAGASIRPLTASIALGQISVIDKNTFEIYVRRGSMKISYLDDTEIIAQGKSYRVELDSAEDGPSTKAKVVRTSTRKRKRIALFTIGGGAVAGATWAVVKLCESPYSL